MALLRCSMFQTVKLRVCLWTARFARQSGCCVWPSSLFFPSPLNPTTRASRIRAVAHPRARTAEAEAARHSDAIRISVLSSRHRLWPCSGPVLRGFVPLCRPCCTRRGGTWWGGAPPPRAGRRRLRDGLRTPAQHVVRGWPCVGEGNAGCWAAIRTREALTDVAALCLTAQRCA
jgi:hypothetical protein